MIGLSGCSEDYDLTSIKVGSDIAFVHIFNSVKKMGKQRIRTDLRGSLWHIRR